MENLTEFKKFIYYLANISANIIRPYFRTGMNIEHKEDKSPVTVADKNAEEAMRKVIIEEYPEHGIVGEEFGSYKENAEYKWVLDPIDGTKSFICGVLGFGTLIALLKNDEPILGAINQPILNEFLIGDNNTTFINNKPASVRNCNDISEAVLLTTDHINIEKYHNLEKFEKLIRKVRLYRSWGDCYGYYLLATGFADVMIDPIMSFWDTMALIPIIKGAGGIITDCKGDDPANGSSIIAASPGIHSQVLKWLN
ncbi:MAG: histidinol-phosphatase [Ignavibacteriaceae bacterium]|jgi:histidinol phosphatase-like enzyme (inositol monophosphatase family)